MTRKCCWLLALALAGSGCVNPLIHFDEEKTPNEKAMEAQPLPPPPPPAVMPDEVTEENAPQAAQALANEMNYEEMQRSSAPPLHSEIENIKKP